MVESRSRTVMGKYVLGLDFGTLDARTVLVNVKTGKELATSVYSYPSGKWFTNGRTLYLWRDAPQR